MGDMVDGELWEGTSRADLSAEERREIKNRLYKAAADRGEYPEAIFGTRPGAIVAAFTFAGCLAVLGGMMAFGVHQEAEQKRIFDENVQNIDRRDWPDCVGRQAYWRDNCVEPVMPQ